MNQMWGISFPWWQFIVRALVVYLSVLFLLRLAGKRQISQMSTGEFVAILLISNAVQNSMNGGDNSITGGLILAGVIIGVSILVDYGTYKSRKIEHLVQGRPTLLIRNGVVLEDHLRKELLNDYELKTLLRRQGIHTYEDIAAAILESDGSVSVIKKSESSQGNGQHLPDRLAE